MDSKFAATTSVSSVFQNCGAATAKAQLPRVDSLTGGTTRRLVLVERSVRRPGKSSTRSADRGNVVHRQWRQREFKVGGDEPCEPTVRLPD